MKKKIVFLLALCLCGIFTFAQTVFKHIATGATILNNNTTLDNGVTNNHPEAVLIVTADYGASGPYLNKSVGVWYNGNRWKIYNQDRTAMARNAQYNVLAVSPGANAFVYTASAATITAHTAIIDHPGLNNNPGAKILITQNWGSEGPYNDHPIGLYFAGGKWRVFNQDRAAIPANAKFNIYIDNRIFEVQAASPSPSLNWFAFSNPATDNNGAAIVFTSQLWTSVYNPNETGVWFNLGRWSVFNQNPLNRMPANAKFNVLALGGTPSRVTRIPAALWQTALNSLLRSMQIRINNFTPRAFEFTGDNTFKFHKPNDCLFRIGTGDFVVNRTFDLRPMRMDPMTIYIENINKISTTASHESGKIRVKVTFEQTDLEVRTNCIDNFGCGAIGNPNFNFENPALEVLIRPIVVDGRLSYDQGEVRLYGALNHDGFNLTIDIIRGILGMFNFDVNNELRTRGSAFMTNLVNNADVKRTITDGLNAHLERAASFGFTFPADISNISIDASGDMIITQR